MEKIGEICLIHLNKSNFDFYRTYKFKIRNVKYSYDSFKFLTTFYKCFADL